MKEVGEKINEELHTKVKTFIEHCVSVSRGGEKLFLSIDLFCFCFVLRHINHKRSFNASSVFEVN